MVSVYRRATTRVRPYANQYIPNDYHKFFTFKDDVISGKENSQNIQLLIDKAGQLGLPDVDIMHAGEFLKYGEYNLCLDHIAPQLYEYGIAIDNECYDIVMELSVLTDISQLGYGYLETFLPLQS